MKGGISKREWEGNSLEINIYRVSDERLSRYVMENEEIVVSQRGQDYR